MAELDKSAIMNLLQGVLGEEKSREAQNLVQTVLENPNSGDSPRVPQVSESGASDNLIDTAAMMRQITNLMGRFNQAKNTKEVILLSAIRPYLRASRQPKVDSCLKILQAYEVFHDMKKSGRRS